VYHLGTAFNKESMKDLGRCTQQLPLTVQTRRGLLVSQYGLLISYDLFNPFFMDLDRCLTERETKVYYNRGKR